MWLVSFPDPMQHGGVTVYWYNLSVLLVWEHGVGIDYRVCKKLKAGGIYKTSLNYTVSCRSLCKARPALEAITKYILWPGGALSFPRKITLNVVASTVYREIFTG